MEDLVMWDKEFPCVQSWLPPTLHQPVPSSHTRSTDFLQQHVSERRRCFKLFPAYPALQTEARDAENLPGTCSSCFFHSNSWTSQQGVKQNKTKGISLGFVVTVSRVTQWSLDLLLFTHDRISSACIGAQQSPGHFTHITSAPCMDQLMATALSGTWMSCDHQPKHSLWPQNEDNLPADSLSLYIYM